MEKKYVKVMVEIDENGNKKPKTITFNNHEYEIDKVLDMKKAVSMKVGGIGERYTVRINGHETYLYFENNKWFVESH